MKRLFRLIWIMILGIPVVTSCDDFLELSSQDLIIPETVEWSPETHNHYRSAIKFLYKKVLNTVWDDDTVPAMKRERNLPAVLSRDEINAIIDATPNLKHKAIIATMYSSGLRVSEVVHLHYDDISRTNMTIHVRETKGRIDRYTILSQKNLDLLTEYWYKCGRPKDILFPSSWSGGYLDIASVNQFFKKSAKLAGITRHVSSHACRHSFASHLFESGTDIKYIQSRLGHVDPRSTDVYLHVSNKTLLLSLIHICIHPVLYFY